MLCDLAPVFAEIIAKRVVEARKQEQAWIDEVTAEFSDEQLAVFNMRCKKKLKTLKMGYMFWGMMGSHYLYTGRPVKQVLFWATLGGVGIWWMMDLFLMFFVVDHYNRKVKTEVIEQIFAEQPMEMETPPMPEELEAPTSVECSEEAESSKASTACASDNPYGGQMGFSSDGGS